MQNLIITTPMICGIIKQINPQQKMPTVSSADGQTSRWNKLLTSWYL
jgi:hypothetical protein